MCILLRISQSGRNLPARITARRRTISARSPISPFIGR